MLLKIHGAGPDPAKLASAVGLTLALVHFAAKKLAARETTHLEKAFIAYLGLFAGCVFFLKDAHSKIVLGHSIAILYSVLFLMASLPQLLGYEPFTHAIARQRQPESVWETPQFYAINLRISWFFAGIFLISALSSFFGREAPVFSILIPLSLIFGAGIPFSMVFPRRYLRRVLER